MKKSFIFAILFVALIAMIIILNTDRLKSYETKYEGTDLSREIDSISKTNTYSSYLNKHADASVGTKEIPVSLLDYTAEGEVEVLSEYEGREDCLLTNEESVVTWNVNVPEAGLYQLHMDYYATKARGVDIERSVMINGELPYLDADIILFSRIWKDGAPVKVDNRGNEIRPVQTEVFSWQDAYFKDSKGFQDSPLLFYFNEGNNTLTMTAVNEPMVIGSLTLTGVNELQSYSEYINKQPADSSSDTAKNYVQVIQGEDADRRSDASLYARYDRSSSATEPTDPYHTILNVIGGTAWNAPGQWIEWEFEVPEDGYYNISIKGRQNYQRGTITSRLVYIDGELPFKEASVIGFEYLNKWDTRTLSDEDGNPYNYYLTKGTHTIRLEATLGELGGVLEDLNNSINRMNAIFRRILILTGATPDEFRTYRIDKIYPDVMEAMDLEYKRLYKIVDDMIRLTGQKSDKIAPAYTLAVQMEDFCENPEEITRRFGDFKNNITSLSTAAMSLSETKLDIDTITITGTKAEVPVKAENVFTKAAHSLNSFIASYVVDYNSLGNVYDEEDETITVWISTGRDQSTILKTLIDDSFTPESGIGVNLKLVAANALLSAVVAGQGPDVVLSIESTLPVDYALRNAVEDLTQFDDLDSILSRFNQSAYSAFRFEDGIYALPETQIYNLMFYREDILEELGLSVPETWQELLDIMPTIQGNNMTVGIHPANIGLLHSMNYQNGGTLYNESGSKTVLDSNAGVKAFETYTSLFLDYGVPIEFDLVSRFRSGEMPIAIADYTTYNTLVVSAPEIYGMWDFTLIPGTERTKDDGTTYIDHSVHSTGQCCAMLKTDDETIRKNAWEFMKWWTRSDTQVSFGREIECVLGKSARHATANIEAFEQLPWSSKQISVLKEQLSWTVGYREVAGGYYTPRHINNAVRRVTNMKENPREVMIDYVRTINEELEKKRLEFGLPVE